MRYIAILCATLSILAAPPHGEVHLAIAEVTEEIREEPHNGELYFKRGRLYQVDGDFDNAMVDYLISEQLDTSLVIVNYYKATLCFEHGMMDRATSYINEFLDKLPGHPRGRFVRSLINIAMQQNRSALDDIKLAITLLDPLEPEHFLLAATAELKIDSSGHVRRALDWLEFGEKELGGFNVVLAERYIEIAREHQRYDLALYKADQVSKHFQRKEKWLLSKGQIFEAAGEPAQALLLYVQCLEEISDLPPKYKNTRSIMYLESEAIAGITRIEGE